MTSRHDLDATLAWMREGTTYLLDAVAGLTDDDLSRPSALPRWTRAHVVGHVARNAEALTRLATWARTGVESPMYPTPDARAAEIEQSATLPADVLRADLAKTAETLDTALDRLTPEQWEAQVRSALGRAIPAAEVPWMRIREVWLHAVDLGAGATVDDLPSGVVDLLVDDVTTALSGKDGCPSVVLTASDSRRTWQLGPTAETAEAVTGTAADLAAWLTGRAPGDGRPQLPRWL
jgi:maleylpyruvate isomerase